VQEGDASESADALRKRVASLRVSDASGARYYGGLRFDPSREPDEEWAPFGAYRFVLPRFELHSGEGEATLVCNLVLPRDADRSDEILEEIEGLCSGRTNPTARRATRCRRPSPEGRPGPEGLEGERRAGAPTLLRGPPGEGGARPQG
jgi:menaquinone-specific isochorismate synthase